MIAHAEGLCSCCGKEQKIELDLDSIEGIRWIPANWHCIEEMQAVETMKAELAILQGVNN